VLPPTSHFRKKSWLNTVWIKLHLDLKVNISNVIVNYTKTIIKIYELKNSLRSRHNYSNVKLVFK
jgi:hypothetical protein